MWFYAHNERSRQMGIFTPYLLCALFLIAMYGFARLTLYFSNISARRSIYKSGVYTAKTVYTLLLASFGSKNILSNGFLSRAAEQGIAYEHYDHILILNGEIVMITICAKDGKIQNPPMDEIWTSRIRMRNGTERELEFENPVIAGAHKKEALSKIMEKAKCRFQIPIRHIVIFPSRRVSFTLPRAEEIMSPPEAMRFLTQSAKKSRFTKEQRKKLKKAIMHFSRSESQIRQIEAKKAKRRHR